MKFGGKFMRSDQMKGGKDCSQVLFNAWDSQSEIRQPMVGIVNAQNE